MQNWFRGRFQEIKKNSPKTQKKSKYEQNVHGENGDNIREGMQHKPAMG